MQIQTKCSFICYLFTDFYYCYLFADVIFLHVIFLQIFLLFLLFLFICYFFACYFFAVQSIWRTYLDQIPCIYYPFVILGKIFVPIMINNTKLDGIIIDSTFNSTYHMIDAQLVLFSFFIDKIEKIMSLLYCSFQICTIFIKKTF